MAEVIAPEDVGETPNNSGVLARHGLEDLVVTLMGAGYSDADLVRMLQSRYGVRISAAALGKFRARRRGIGEAKQLMKDLCETVPVAHKFIVLTLVQERLNDLRQEIQKRGLVWEEPLPGGRSRDRFIAPLIESELSLLRFAQELVGGVGPVQKLLLEQNNFQFNNQVKVVLTWSDGTPA